METINLTSSTNESSTVQNAEVFRISKASLESSEIYTILSNFDPVLQTYVERIKEAKPDEVYIFFSNDQNKSEDFSYDNYLWKNNGAFKKILEKKVLFY